MNKNILKCLQLCVTLEIVGSFLILNGTYDKIYSKPALILRDAIIPSSNLIPQSIPIRTFSPRSTYPHHPVSAGSEPQRRKTDVTPLNPQKQVADLGARGQKDYANRLGIHINYVEKDLSGSPGICGPSISSSIKELRRQIPRMPARRRAHTMQMKGRWTWTFLR